MLKEGAFLLRKRCLERIPRAPQTVGDGIGLRFSRFVTEAERCNEEGKTVAEDMGDCFDREGGLFSIKLCKREPVGFEDRVEYSR